MRDVCRARCSGADHICSALGMFRPSLAIRAVSRSVMGSSSGKAACRCASVAACAMKAESSRHVLPLSGFGCEPLTPIIGRHRVRLVFEMSEEAGAIPARSRHCDSKPDLPSFLKRTLLWDARSREVLRMAQSVAGTLAPQPVSIPAIPLGEVLPWAIFGGLLMLLAIYFVGAEQGATVAYSWPRRP